MCSKPQISSCHDRAFVAMKEANSAECWMLAYFIGMKLSCFFTVGGSEL